MTTNIFNQYSHQTGSSASSEGKIKLEQHIHGKILTARQVLEQVESQLIHDQVVKGSALDFKAACTAQTMDSGYCTSCGEYHPQTAATQIQIHTPAGILSLHDHALMQMASKAGVPAIYTRNLMQGENWRQELLAHNFKEIYSRGNGSKYLIRSVDQQARGFLSDRFKRMDSRPLLDSFCGGVNQLGAVPVEGFALDTKMRMRAILPVVFEPMAGEVFAFGVEFGTSDFGDGGLYLSIFLLRLTCLNGATMQDVMRKIHLGSRLSEDITFSQQTYELDTKANAAALGDAVKFALSPARLDAYMGVLQKANENEITDVYAEKNLKKLLSKEEAELAFNAYKSPDVVNLPAGKTQYRMSNAISWIANFEDTSRSRQLELQKIAGDVLPAPPAEVSEMAQPPRMYQ